MTIADYCQTPGYAIDPLIRTARNEFWEIDTDDTIWEPACGEGYLMNELERHANVWGSDIREDNGGNQVLDFLSPDAVPGENVASITHIITNPPFSLAKEFTNKALDWRILFSDWKIALLMQSRVVSTMWFNEVVKQHGEPGIIWFNPRVNFKMPNKGWSGSGSHFATAWFTWNWLRPGNYFVRMSHWDKNYRMTYED